MSSVVVSICEKYDKNNIIENINNIIRLLDIQPNFFNDKKIVIKPNLVSPKDPEKAATTHPTFIEALGEILKQYTPRSVIIAESSGGPYTNITLSSLYKGCKIDAASASAGIPLNYDTGFQKINLQSGNKIHDVLAINPIIDADVIINLSKLKTHSLTLMSAATKNFFGTVPGIHKFELHSRFPKQPDFQNMIIDIANHYYETKKLLCICDAIDCMEGNGPTNGNSRHIGMILGSLSPFNLDIVAEHVLGLDGQVQMCNYMAQRNLTPRSYQDITVLGSPFDNKIQHDWVVPDSHPKGLINNFQNILGGRLVRFIAPHPIINQSKCIGCGKCIESCPKKTIESITKANKKRAIINPSKCIRCFCCQELCPHNAIDIKTNPLFTLIH